MLVVRSVAVGPFAENTFLAGCDRTGEAILIDPGGELPRVLALREPGGFSVKRILLTHGHIDHVAGAAEAAEATGAPVEIHPADLDWFDAIEDHGEMFGFTGVRAPPIARHLAGGDRLQVGDEQLRVIHTPGHTRGGCSLFFEAARVLFTGDALFVGSVGRTDLPGGDFRVLARSLREKVFPLGDDVRFYPGHGAAGLLGDERRNNPFVGQGRQL
ncbi:MBL fold metallo-hydrolase [Anaeromyxobacter paludicola]|uniref:MBL fold metallo-hydrolase n=1 Tax=Anaeromyxobacter paludicola TaxID=2918171 RepID=A0ABM7XAB5_9BACT|nr:MBL fold metallo-hydrolase [Anaeromyxobacter paludicola]BDG08793.1 MBL fold metallo-hydrolase [Anaeromyxobacter paludicola]